VREAGLSDWVANLPVSAGGRAYVLDMAFEAQRVEVAVDGRAFHTDARSFQNDRTRQNDLVAAGWTVLRFTWEDIVDRPADVVRRIREILAQRAA
jgi:very-short-patch-repair endonuclease